jgi:hypothetical protein
MPPAVEFPEIHEFGGLGGFGGEIPKSLIPTPKYPPPWKYPEIHEIHEFGGFGGKSWKSTKSSILGSENENSLN